MGIIISIYIYFIVILWVIIKIKCIKMLTAQCLAHSNSRNGIITNTSIQTKAADLPVRY